MICVIRHLRVWFGPLPFVICHIESLSKVMAFWYYMLILFMITLTKFMFICIWKRMRQMNDDLIVRLAVNWAIFISIWIPCHGYFTNFQISNSHEAICTGDYSFIKQMDWQKLDSTKTFFPFPPYGFFAPLIWICLLTTLVLLILVKMKSNEYWLNQSNNVLIQPPKNMDSIILNFIFIVLLITTMICHTSFKKG